MNHRRRSAFPPLAALSALAALALHCTGDSGDGPAAARAVNSGRQLQISDALHSGGTRGFYWLPPVVPRAAFRGDFLPDLDPRVRIDELRPDGTVARTLATFTRSTGPGGERVRVHLERGGHDHDDHDRDDDPSGYYYVRWNTHCAALSPTATYRIRALVPQAGGGLRELGFADVDVVRNAREVRAVDRDDFVPLVAGQTLRIKFRIDRPCVDGDGDGVYDARDNCPLTPNADQRDTDRDGRGDVCECDGVTCSPVDACHSAGACDATGACTRPVAPDGVGCPLANATGACAAGSCRVASCAAGYADCDGAAGNGCERSTRTLGDCGACGVACAAAPHAAATCATGVCALACAAGWADCDGDRANGCERDVAASDANCGACGNTCADGRTCQAGACTASVCTAGRANCDGVEANGCEVTLADNLAHCGACGNACAAPHATPRCAAGACGVAACDPGYTDCNAVAADCCEVSTAGDVAHCGACGRACVIPNATPVCLGGRCGVGRCAEGWADVNDDPRDGCEVDLDTDPHHCGAVGNACVVAHGAPGCVGGACVVASCDVGFADCDGAVGDGCEVDTRVDPSRCGSCGNACQAGANAAAVCAGGLCGLQCAAGFADCNRFTSDGCEVNVAASTRHCGACGNACADGRACVAGACTAAVCAAGRANCDGVEANGCEVTLATSVAHCGACGNACSFAHTTAECNAGACGFSVCVAGWADCDGVQADGCETSLVGDVANCGACGVRCAANELCNAGRCERPTFLVTQAGNDGAGSLRAALAAVDASPVGGRVVFAIAPAGPHTIRLASPVGAQRPVEIDGATQPGFAGSPLITLDGAAIANDQTMFQVSGAGSVVRNLAMREGGAMTAVFHDCHGCLIEDLDLTRASPVAVYGGLQLLTSRGATVRRVRSRNNAPAIAVIEGSDVTLSDNDLRENGSQPGLYGSALYLYHVAGVTIPGGFQAWGNLFGGGNRRLITVQSNEPVWVAGAMTTGLNLALERESGAWNTANTALRLHSPRASIRDVDLSWEGANPPVGNDVIELIGGGANIVGLRIAGRPDGVRIEANGNPATSNVYCSSTSLEVFGGSVSVSQSDLAGRTVMNISTDTVMSTLTAEENWWGAPTGPSNLGGAGSGWSGLVTAHTWLVTRPSCAP